jgi:hypothetical protein
MTKWFHTRIRCAILFLGILGIARKIKTREDPAD